MEKTIAREAPPSPHRRYARARLDNARHNCNYLFDQLGYALEGFAFDNLVAARKLRQLQVDILQPNLISPTSPNEPEWRAPKGALEFVQYLAMVVVHWTIRAGEHAGEKYRGIHASAREVASALGISERQWRRTAKYDADGQLVARGGTLAWAEHHRLVRAFSTTRRTHGGWKSKEGQALRFREGKTYYEPGDALLKLLGIHERRVRYNRNRLLRSIRSEKFADQKLCRSSLREDLAPHRKRGRAQGQLLVRQLQRVAPATKSVGRGKARGRRAPTAPLADERPVPCNAQNRKQPDGHEGRIAASAGGVLAIGADAAPAAAGAPIGAAGTSRPLSDPDALHAARLRVFARQLAGDLTVEEAQGHILALERGEHDSQNCARNVGAPIAAGAGLPRASSSPPEGSPGGGGAPPPRLPSTDDYERQPTKLRGVFAAIAGDKGETALRKLAAKVRNEEAAKERAQQKPGAHGRPSGRPNAAPPPRELDDGGGGGEDDDAGDDVDEDLEP